MSALRRALSEIFVTDQSVGKVTCFQEPVNKYLTSLSIANGYGYSERLCQRQLGQTGSRADFSAAVESTRAGCTMVCGKTSFQWRAPPLEGRNSSQVEDTPALAKQSRTARTASSASPWTRMPTAGPEPHTKTLSVPGVRTSSAVLSPGTIFSQVGGRASARFPAEPSFGRAKNSASSAARWR
jgi:hypothetical protein